MAQTLDTHFKRLSPETIKVINKLTCFQNKGDSEANMQADLEYDQLALDSKRWNAFINSPFRLFGYAGLDHKEPNRPDQETGKNGYAHFGCEMWTIHGGREAGAGKDILIGYADQAIKVQSNSL